jgi:hypothetical protein
MILPKLGNITRVFISYRLIMEEYTKVISLKFNETPHIRGYNIDVPVRGTYGNLLFIKICLYL